MNIFVTGGSGFIGTAVLEELISAGHQVQGLARSDAAAQTISKLGAAVVRGHLEDKELLQQAAAQSDAVIHLAFVHDFQRYQESALIDQQAILAIGEAIAGSDKPLVVTAGILGIGKTNRLITETNRAIGLPRSSEATALALAERGIRSSVVRLAPSVHDRHDHGFIPFIIQQAKRNGVSAYPGNGQNRWPAIHRRDAARLFRLAVEKKAAGALYNGVAEEGLPLISIAQLIAQKLDVPLVTLPEDELNKHFDWMSRFISYDAPADNRQTCQQLAWEPKEIGLLEDMDLHYFEQ